MLSSEIIEAAKASHAKFFPRGPFVSVSLAQFGLESAWGTRLSGRFNYFGIKANEAQIEAGASTTVYTKEQKPSGQWYVILAKFANFDSPQDAFDAHARLLTTEHYARCMDAGTPEDYCRALQADGYATALGYSDALIRVIRTGSLTQYDDILSNK